MPWVRSTDGVRLHYRESGRRSGPPVLMIQGLGADKHLWNLQRLALAPWYRTIAFDNRGAGRSDKPYGAYSMEQMADDAVAVLDHAGVDSAHVIGASMGGVISQIMALAPPRADPIADPGVHGLPPPRVAPGAPRRMGRYGEERGDGRHDGERRALGDRSAFVPEAGTGARLDGTPGAVTAGTCLRRAGRRDPVDRRRVRRRSCRVSPLRRS